MKKLLIAVNSWELAQQIRQDLSGVFEIHICHDGQDALELLSCLRPEVMVLDLMLETLDGISLLQIARDGGINTKVIAVSSVYTDYILSALERLQVQYALRLSVGCVSGLKARILDVATWEEPDRPQTSLVLEILTTLGIRVTSKSYRFLETAIFMHIADPTQHIVSQLYPAVALSCGGTATQVEKAIRTTIGDSYLRCNPRVWHIYFPSESGCYKPTNSEFIKIIADCVIKQTAFPEERNMRSCVAL